jgi:hypothetical protein
MNRETFITLNKTRLFTANQVVDIVQSERDKVLEIVLDIISTATIRYATLDDADYMKKLLRQQAGE